MKIKAVIRFAFVLLVAVLHFAAASGQSVADSTGEKKFRKFGLGFSAGVRVPFFKIDFEPGLIYATGTDSLKEIDNDPAPTIQLGLIGSLALNENTSLRFLPSVVLDQADFTLTFNKPSKPGEDSTAKFRTEASYLLLPLALKYVAKGEGKARLFVQGGFQYHIHLSPSKILSYFAVPGISPLRQNYLSVIAGIGAEVQGSKMRICPELRFSYSLSNLATPENPPVTPLISKASVFSAAFLLNFY